MISDDMRYPGRDGGSGRGQPPGRGQPRWAAPVPLPRHRPVPRRRRPVAARRRNTHGRNRGQRSAIVTESCFTRRGSPLACLLSAESCSLRADTTKQHAAKDRSLSRQVSHAAGRILMNCTAFDRRHMPNPAYGVFTIWSVFLPTHVLRAPVACEGACHGERNRSSVRPVAD